MTTIDAPEKPISTHSLTKRLTLGSKAMLLFLFHFNSQPHEEADDITADGVITEDEFQLTASRRG